MCCLFGIYNYKQNLNQSQTIIFISVLSKESEARWTDATGIAYNYDKKLHIFKKALPAHQMKFHLPAGVHYVMGHTRTEEDFSRINDVFHNSAVFREKIGYSKVIMLQEEYDVFNDINHTLEPDFNSMYFYYLGMIDSTLPSPDTELEEFTVTPNEAVLKELEADQEPLDNSFEIICIRTSNHVEPDEEC